jgi:hypothetical protein
MADNQKRHKTLAAIMQAKASVGGDGFYEGEVTISIDDMSDAVEAARRLLDNASYNKVKMGGDQQQCIDFGKDVVKVAEMLMKMTVAVADARMIPGSQGVH